MKIIICIIVFSLIGCQNRNTESSQKNNVVEFIGKEIQIPEKLSDKMLSVDKKILVYTGKEECTECQLSLPQWKHKIKELRQINKQVDVVFVINTVDSVEIKSLFEKEKMTVPLFFDHKNAFFVKNKIPKENNLHTFLLDKNNRVVLIGSPINNEKMWNLYKEVISKD